MQRILMTLILSFLLNFGFEICAQNRLSSPSKISGVEHSEAKNLVKPLFPFGCKCKFTSNEIVDVELLIDSYGKVYKSTAVSGHPFLRVLAIAAANKSEFTANRVSNVLSGARIVIRYEFVRNGKVDVAVTLVKIDSDPLWLESCSDCTPVRREPLFNPPPKFPSSGIFLRLTDTINVEIIVTESGRVESAQAYSGHPVLRKSAEDAALRSQFVQWKPTPQRTRHILTIPYHFKR